MLGWAVRGPNSWWARYRLAIGQMLRALNAGRPLGADGEDLKDVSCRSLLAIHR